MRPSFVINKHLMLEEPLGDGIFKKNKIKEDVKLCNCDS